MMSVPTLDQRQIVPAASIEAITLLATMSPPLLLRFDVSRRVDSHGHTVTTPGLTGSKVVTLTATAVAVGGTVTVSPVGVVSATPRTGSWIRFGGAR